MLRVFPVCGWLVVSCSAILAVGWIQFQRWVGLWNTAESSIEQMDCCCQAVDCGFKMLCTGQRSQVVIERRFQLTDIPAGINCPRQKLSVFVEFGLLLLGRRSALRKCGLPAIRISAVFGCQLPLLIEQEGHLFQ